MKTIKRQLGSLLLIIILLIVNVSPAVTKANALSKTKDIISASLKEEMKKNNNSIPVILWYTDIDHDNAKHIAEENIGFSLDEIDEKSLSVSYDDYYKDNNNAGIDDIAAMKAYMQLTAEERQKKQLLIDEYTAEKLAAEKELYTQESERIITLCGIERNDIEFVGNYSPVIISFLSSDQIYKIAKQSDIICELDYSENREEIDCSDQLGDLRDSAYITKVFEDMGVTGAGVKVGILERFTVYRVGYEDELPDNRFNTVGTPKYGETPNTFDNHARDTARVFCGKYGVAKSSICYSVSVSGCSASTSTGRFFQATEALIDKQVNVINCSYGSITTSAYTSWDKFVDHIANTHLISFVCSAGNHSGQHPGYTVLSPGKAYNAITVGAFDNNNTRGYSDDEMSSSSCYDECGGCEKPELIAPSNMLGGGTSRSAPFVAGIVALMLEARQSLREQNPAIVKAILIASCHHKVTPTQGNNQEEMSDGITEIQGAGAVDAFIALAITFNGNYGLRKLAANETSSSTATVFQPSYGAAGINFSIAWLRNNTVSNCTSIPDNTVSSVTLGSLQNLTLQIKQNGSPVGTTSSNEKSSVEMVYLEPNESNIRYDINVTRNTNINVECIYAYAWSISNERYQHTNEYEQVTYLRNQKSGYYLVASASSLSQGTFSVANSRRWIIDKTASEYDLETLLNSSSIGVGAALSNSDKNAILNSTNGGNIYFQQEDDGSITICTSISGVNYALSIKNQSTQSGADVIWSPLTDNRMDQRWYIQKYALQRGDVDSDYAIEADDASLALSFASGTATPNAIKKFLADFNGNKIITSADSRHILRIAQGLE